MKKNTKLLVSIISSLIFVILAFIPIYFICFKNKEIVVEDLILTRNNLTLNVGDKVELKNFYNLKPLGAKTNVLCLIENSKFATISGDNVLTAKGVGNTKIYFRVSAGDEFIEKNIDLSVNQKLSIPSSISFEFDSITLDIFETKTNKLTTSQTNCEASITYSSPNVCKYNHKTGVITPIGVGSTTLTIKFSDKENEISKSFEVCVVKNITKEIVIENLSKESDFYECSVEVGRSKTLNLNFYEDGNVVDDYDFDYQLLDENLLEVNATNLITTPTLGANKLQFKAKATGEIFIKIFVNNSVKTEIILKVKVI